MAAAAVAVITITGIVCGFGEADGKMIGVSGGAGSHHVRLA
jgi:hypothetical protein